jgi:hypothetical protein
MFKINQRTITNAVAGVKNGFRSAVGHAVKFASTLPKHYQTARKMLGDVNDAYTTAKKAYSVLEPMIGNPSINKHVMKAVSNYEAIRNKVMDGHETIVNNIEMAKSGLKKAGVRAVF